MSAIDNIISDLIGVSMAASSGVGNVNDVFKIRDDLRGLIAAALADAESKGAEARRAEIEAQEPWGWAIVDKYGHMHDARAAVGDFFGASVPQEPFSPERLAMTDRDWQGLAPHRIVTLFTRPVPAQAAPERKP